MKAQHIDPNPSGMCICGCGLPTKTVKHGGGLYAPGDHYRYVLGHQHRKSAVEYIVDENGCWVWQLAVGGGGLGYGMMNLHDGTYGRAHRVFYERTKGPIPDGFHVDHLCRNTLCVNPAHLEAVPCATNVRRGRATRFTDRDVCAMRWLVSIGVSRSVVADRFGTTYAYVSSLLARTWAVSVTCPATEGLLHRPREAVMSRP